MIAGQFVGNPAFGIDPKKLFSEMAGANLRCSQNPVHRRRNQAAATAAACAAATNRCGTDPRRERAGQALQFEAQENRKTASLRLMAQLDAELKQMEAAGQQQISVANMRAKLADSAMKRAQ